MDLQRLRQCRVSGRAARSIACLRPLCCSPIVSRRGVSPRERLWRHSHSNDVPLPMAMLPLLSAGVGACCATEDAFKGESKEFNMKLRQHRVQKIIVILLHYYFARTSEGHCLYLLIDS